MSCNMEDEGKRKDSDGEDWLYVYCPVDYTEFCTKYKKTMC